MTAAVVIVVLSVVGISAAALYYRHRKRGAQGDVRGGGSQWSWGGRKLFSTNSRSESLVGNDFVEMRDY